MQLCLHSCVCTVRRCHVHQQLVLLVCRLAEIEFPWSLWAFHSSSKHSLHDLQQPYALVCTKLLLSHTHIFLQVNTWSPCRCLSLQLALKQELIHYLWTQKMNSHRYKRTMQRFKREDIRVFSSGSIHVAVPTIKSLQWRFWRFVLLPWRQTLLWRSLLPQYRMHTHKQMASSSFICLYNSSELLQLLLDSWQRGRESLAAAGVTNIHIYI